MLQNYNSAVERELYAGPGRWNDPDMLYVGKGEFDESNIYKAKAHMSLWAMMSSPLIMGADIRNTPDSINQIMTNESIIAINQDKAGHQATRIYQDDQYEILIKTLTGEYSTVAKKAVLLLNKTASPKKVTLTSKQLNFVNDSKIKVFDAWRQKNLANFSNSLTLTVPAYGVRVLQTQGQHILGEKRYLSELPGLVHVAKQFKNSANVNKATDGSLLSSHGKVYTIGIGVSANSLLQVKLDGQYSQFQALTAVNDFVETGKGLVSFSVYGDGKLLWQSEYKKSGDIPSQVSVDVSGVNILELAVKGRGGDEFNHANRLEPILSK